MNTMTFRSGPAGMFQITSPFGAHESFRDKPHTGIDIAMPENTEVESLTDGLVERVVDYGNENIGRGVIVRSDDGSYAIYGHLNDATVTPGDFVSAGDLVGLSGNTGASTGPHLHFGMMKNGEYVDPTATLAGMPEHHKGILWRAFEKGADNVREGAQNMAQDFIYGVLDAVRDTLVDLAYSVALIGGGLSIIFRVVGWDSGYKWAGILTLGYVLIRYLLGG